MARDFRNRTTIQIQLDLSKEHEHADTHRGILDYIAEKKKHRNWNQVFRDSIVLYETLETGSTHKLKQMFPHMWLRMVLEAQQEAIKNLNIQPQQKTGGIDNDRITEADRDRYASLIKMRNLLGD